MLNTVASCSFIIFPDMASQLINRPEKRAMNKGSVPHRCKKTQDTIFMLTLILFLSGGKFLMFQPAAMKLAIFSCHPGAFFGALKPLLFLSQTTTMAWYF